MAVLAQPDAPAAVADRRRNRPDWILASALLALSGLGMLMIFSATRVSLERAEIPASFSMERQLIFVATGLLVFSFISLVDYREFRNLAALIYLGAIVALGVVFLFAPVNGAQRWIPVSFFKLQPSEFAKLATVVMVAGVLAPTRTEGVSWARLARVVALVGIPAVLVYLEPDLGTTAVLVFIAAVMVFSAGARFRQLALLVAAGGGMLFLARRLGLLDVYQLDRINTLLNPEAVDPLDEGFTIIQSKLAIGSGQLFGKGLFNGTQTNYGYVPEQETDFIFTAVGEQLGFIGGVLVLAAFLVIAWRLVVIARASRDRFGALLAMGVAAWVVFHVFVNVGMTIGIMPVTGIPLPFLSLGGSSYLAISAGLGVANSVWLRRSPVPGETYII